MVQLLIMMVRRFVIREAVETDLDEMTRVFVDTVRFEYRGYLPDDFLEALTHDQEKEARRRAMLVPGSFCFIAADLSRQEIVGIAYGAPRKGLNKYNRGVLEDLCVLPDYQRLGIGTELFWAFALEHQKRGRQDMLARSFRDHHSNGFYESMEGQLVTLSPRSYGSKKVDEIEYIWTLDDLRNLRRAAMPIRA